MGIYVNPGNNGFYQAVNDDIYVDKTGLIEYTNSRLFKSGRFICVSRPRRFGKSMAEDMLTAYYSRGCDSAELFAGRKAEACSSYAKHLNRHNVIRFDVQRFITARGDLEIFTDRIEAAVIRELETVFPGMLSKNETRMITALEAICSGTGEGFIFIIDEWDCVFRMAKDDVDTQKRYLDFLRGLFKGAPYVELAYMTGILPIKKYGEHSAVNMFDEYSMTDPKNMGSFFGFTAGEAAELCRIHGASFEAVEQWYDGYLVGDEQIYNPKSVVDALTWKKIRSYWTGTETYEALKIYIDLNFDGLKEAIIEMLGGAGFPVDPTTFQNDMTTFRSKDDVLTLLVHLGYLTYSEQTGEVFIPNQEIEQEFVRSIKMGSEWGELAASLNSSEAILESTWKMDGEAVAAGIAQARINTSSIIKYNDENSLSFAIYAAYSAAPAYYMKPVREFPSGRGFADIVYLPKRFSGKPALVIEVKWDQGAEGAIQQIRDKNYAHWLEEYTGDILLVGINYDRKKDLHVCLIEKCRKMEEAPPDGQTGQ